MMCRSAALVGFLTIAPPAAAQATAEDFADRTRAAAPEAGLGYPLIRCAALFRSVRIVLGPEQVGPELMQSAEDIERRLGGAAAMVRADENDGLELEAAIDAVLTDLEAITDLYLARYTVNLKRHGHSWAGDEMLSADRALCESLLERMP